MAFKSTDSHYDLIVVGSSFASSFFLKKYLEKVHSNTRVLVLERGKFLTHADRLAYARSQKLGQFSLTSRGLDQFFDNKESSKPWVFDPNFGGSSNCWVGCTPRFMPNDFQMYSQYGVSVDWPLTYHELEPYYTETEEIMQISGPDHTPYPKSKKYPLPPHILNTVDQVLQNEYGNLYISQPTARASVATGHRGACCTTSVCQLCPVNAKFTIENTLKNIYQDPRVRLELESQVLALDCHDDTVKAVHYTKHEQQNFVTGDIVATGANAIFNAHILLNSGDTNPLLGKGISEQVGLMAYLYLDGLDNVGGSSKITANGFMLYDGEHRRERAGCIIENHNEPFIRNEAGKWRKMAKMKFIFEDLPQNENQVVTSDKKTIPKVKYHTHSDYTQKGIDHLKNNIEKLFACLPIERIVVDNFIQPTESHILGTARMSKSPEGGVVDDKLIHHQYRNLFVLGGSSFPTIPPSNPTLTLSALSLRAADLSF